MTAAELHGRLAAQGIRLSVRDGQLCYRGPSDAVTDDVLDLLRRHKKLLVEWLDPRGKPIAHLLGRLCGKTAPPFRDVAAFAKDGPDDHHFTVDVVHTRGSW